jgi:ABC-2 type transport system permease protein
MTATPAPSTWPASAPGRGDRARLPDLVAAEWIKLRSLRSTLLTLGVCVLYACYAAWQSGHREASVWAHLTAAQRAGQNLGHAVFPGSAWLVLLVLTGVVGALVIVGEHASGLIRTTFSAVPARRRVIAAKVVVVAGILAVTGVVAAAGCYGVGLVELSGQTPAPTVAFADAAGGCAATALLFAACGLAGMAIGALIRNTAATIVTIVVILGLLPTAFKTQGYWWSRDAANAMPAFAWYRLVVPVGGHVADAAPMSVTHAWVTLAVWSLAAVLISVVIMNWRDV